MGFKLSEFEVDPQKDVEGIWIDYIDGSRLKVARIRNPRYIACRDKLFAQNAHRINRRTGTIDPSIVRKINARAMSRFVLLDWEGIEDESGAPVAYTAERGEEAMLKYPELYEDVEAMASSNESYRKNGMKADEGN